MIKVAPSVLAADFSILKEELVSSLNKEES